MIYVSLYYIIKYTLYILTHKCEIDIIASVSFEEYELLREATVLSSTP